MEPWREELRHHGILGMKWGVRRFQNKDGSLTAAGQRRYSDDAREAHALRKKKLSEMSNEELKKLNQRDELENKYRKNHKSKAKKVIAAIGFAAGTIGTVNALYNNGDQLIKNGKKVADTIINSVGSRMMGELNESMMNFYVN